MRQQGRGWTATGAGAGLGRETSLLLAQEGVEAIGSDVSEVRATDTARLEERGHEAVWTRTDVSDESVRRSWILLSGALGESVPETRKLVSRIS